MSTDNERDSKESPTERPVLRTNDKLNDAAKPAGVIAGNLLTKAKGLADSAVKTATSDATKQTLNDAAKSASALAGKVFAKAKDAAADVKKELGGVNDLRKESFANSEAGTSKKDMAKGFWAKLSGKQKGILAGILAICLYFSYSLLGASKDSVVNTSGQPSAGTGQPTAGGGVTSQTNSRTQTPTGATEQQAAAAEKQRQIDAERRPPLQTTTGIQYAWDADMASCERVHKAVNAGPFLCVTKTEYKKLCEAATRLGRGAYVNLTLFSPLSDGGDMRNLKITWEDSDDPRRLNCRVQFELTGIVKGTSSRARFSAGVDAFVHNKEKEILVYSASDYQ